MIHQRQRLPLGLKPGDDLFGVHAQLDDLERDPAADRFLLLGHINHAAAAFANLLEQFVTADAVAGFFGGVQSKVDGSARSGLICRWFLEKSTGILAGLKQFFNALAH